VSHRYCHKRGARGSGAGRPGLSKRQVRFVAGVLRDRLDKGNSFNLKRNGLVAGNGAATAD
jgi:hypothetical protein